MTFGHPERLLASCIAVALVLFLALLMRRRVRGLFSNSVSLILRAAVLAILIFYALEPGRSRELLFKSRDYRELGGIERQSMERPDGRRFWQDIQNWSTAFASQGRGIRQRG